MTCGAPTIPPPVQLQPLEPFADALQHAINANTKRLGACQMACQVDGRLDLSFSVEKDGQLSHVRPVADTLKSPEMTKCVVGVIAGIKIPWRSPDGTPVVVTHPFRFHNGN